jgi:hypothetical protein
VRVVGVVLVRNEDLFVEQAVRNVAAVCDRIHAVDHVSTDGTWDILQRLAGDYEHLEIQRARHARVSHEVLEQYMGEDIWALQVDGDELYDPAGLARLRRMLEANEFDRAFRVYANVLNCVSLEPGAKTASGYLSPPSRPLARLFNLEVVESWTGCGQRLLGGVIRFRPGYTLGSVAMLHERFSWDESPFRFVHACFLRRSSRDDPSEIQPRRSLSESGRFRRGWLGSVTRAVRSPKLHPKVRDIQARGLNWKVEKYRRGERVTVDVGPFLDA